MVLYFHFNRQIDFNLYNNIEYRQSLKVAIWKDQLQIHTFGLVFQKQYKWSLSSG